MQIEGYRIHKWGGELRWESFELPEPRAGEVLIRVEACGIGLTVLNCIRGDLANDPALLPRVPGHELVGRVVALGPGVTSPREGERIMGYFYLACGVCAQCRAGRDSLCENLAGWLGVHVNGGYAPYTVIPARNAIPLPEELPAALATAIPDAVATSLHVCRSRARIGPGDRVVVIGAGGGVGIHMVQMAALCGGDVVGLEIAEEKFEAIEAAGARPVSSRDFGRLDPGLWNGRRPTVVIDLIGSPDSLAWSTRALGTGGRLVLLTTFRDVGMAIDPRDMVFRELTLLGSRYAGKAEMMEAAELVVSGKIRPVVSEVVGPREVERVHEALRCNRLLGRGALEWS